MSYFKNIILGGIILTSAATAHATGNDAGHGGAGIFCPTSKVQFQTFDLYQISLPGYFTVHGLNVPRVRNMALTEEEDVQAQIENALNRLETEVVPNFWTERYPRKEWVAKMREQLKNVQISYAENLPVLDVDLSDFRLKNIPEECKDGVVGVMYWNDSTSNPDGNLLKIDQKKYLQLPVTDRAAMWIHEAYLRTVRISFYEWEKTSRDAKNLVGKYEYPLVDAMIDRGIVGYLFSDYHGKPLTGSNLATSIPGQYEGLNFFPTIDRSIGIRVDLVSYKTRYRDFCEQASFSFAKRRQGGDTYGDSVTLLLGQITSVDLVKIGENHGYLGDYSLNYEGAPIKKRTCRYSVTLFDNLGNPISYQNAAYQASSLSSLEYDVFAIDGDGKTVQDNIIGIHWN